MKDNWYLVLELDFDPPVEDEKVIEDRIKEKTKFWCINFSHFKYGTKYRRWYDSIPHIRKDMIGSENKRLEIAQEASKMYYKDVDELLKLVAINGYVTDVILENIAKKCRMSKSKVDSRRVILGIDLKSEDKTAVDYEDIYRKYYEDKPLDVVKYYNLTNLLSVFACDDIYKFLYDKITNVEKLEVSVLRQRGFEKKTEFKKMAVNHQSLIGLQICGYCDVIFVDEFTKGTYDNYLLYFRRKSILDKIGMVIELTGEPFIDRVYYDSAVEEINRLYKNTELAKSIVDSYLYHNHYCLL